MNSLAKSLVRRIVRTGVRRGLVEGSFPWLFVGVFTWAARALLKPKVPVVRHEQLKPGETLVISNVPPRRHYLRQRQKDVVTE